MTNDKTVLVQKTKGALDSLSPTGRRTPTDPPVLLSKKIECLIELIHNSGDGGLVLICSQCCKAQFTGRCRARNLKKHVAHSCPVTQNRLDYQRASCLHCGQTFTRPDNLHPHVKRKHPTSP